VGIGLDQAGSGYRRWACVNAVMNLQVILNVGNFLTR